MVAQKRGASTLKPSVEVEANFAIEAETNCPIALETVKQWFEAAC
jgi:hypothetical protein